MEINYRTTDAEIEALMQARINAVWPPQAREKALRLGGTLLADLNAFFIEMTTVKQGMLAERDFLLQVESYKSAVARLGRDPLALSDVVVQELVDADLQERQAAQVIVDAASQEVITAAVQ